MGEISKTNIGTAQGNSVTQNATQGTKASVTMQDLSIYPRRLSDEDNRRLQPRYTFKTGEYEREVTNYNERRGWGYSDRDVETMATDYIYGNPRTRAIIYERLEDANFHSAISRIQQLADDPEAIAALEKRARNRRK